LNIGDIPPSEVSVVCRLSIIVPYDRDEASFESTLVSVLENRPEFCEVIVSHDGGYHDPFDLSDEVRFVVAPGSDRLDLIRAGVSASMGRVTHVMTGGVRATENWTDQPVEMFEQSDLGAVAPMIRRLSSDGALIAAGWRDAGGRLQQPIGEGEKTLSRRDQASIQGVYMTASFWRRSTLESMLEIPVSDADGAVDYILAHALNRSAWRCRVADGSEVLASPQAIEPTIGGLANWSMIQSFRTAIGKESTPAAIFNGCLGVALQPFRVAAWREAVARVQGSLASPDAIRSIVREMNEICRVAGPVAAADQILKMPTAGVRAPARRRAA
jgi:hypothetical protein